ADDLGYGDLSCYGSSKLKTPHLDQLAKSGVRLTDFYTGATVCTPSRMALMTGNYPSRLGWKGGVLGHRIKTETGLAPESTTVAEHFKAAGYRTFMSGKWHLGSTAELSPMNQGFDHAFHIKLSNNQTKKLYRDGEIIENPFENRHLSEQFTDEATRFIRSEHKSPFFLYVPYTAPHFPAQAHPDWKGKSTVGAYGDVVEELDYRIGEITTALKESNLEKNTLVVFLSDNGPDPSQRKWATTAPHRGLKWSSLEGGTRVPCIVSWPGVVPRETVCHDLVAAIDLFPTLAHASGIPTGPKSTDGHNVWLTLIDKDTPHPRQTLLYWEGWATPQAIRAGTWKLYFDKTKDVPASQQGPALFDLANDPQEKIDLSTQHPDKVTKMLQQARTQLTEINESSIALGGPPAEQPEPKKPHWLN
ncbi:MAG: sulfatase-like hydrolase/transferase, partial [Verrucomicrobiales bacterium]|nr:sulfatase-like hydrolase/transferase [Verrucomicrobiales bacterium]